MHYLDRKSQNAIVRELFYTMRKMRVNFDVPNSEVCIIKHHTADDTLTPDRPSLNRSIY
jgi:hypothetical protein